jgi:hypothetical protein
MDRAKEPLKKCPVHFFPEGADNAKENSSPRLGFALAESLAVNEVTAKAYMKTQRPKLIFYSASSGDSAWTGCARLITNYADLLL